MIRELCPPELPIQRACALVGLSRSLFYRTPFEQTSRFSVALQDRQTLVERIEAIVLEFPGYGYRRVRAQLMREGFCVSRKASVSAGSECSL